MVPHAINFMSEVEEPSNHPPRDFEPNELAKEGKGRRKKALFLLLAIFLLAGSMWWYNSLTVTTDTIRAGVTLEPKKPKSLLKKISYIAFGNSETGNSNLAGAKTDRINILLLGMGGPGHDGPFLTDTIMIASIKPSTKQVALISIPRDLGVDIPGYGYQKINHVNAYGELKKPNWGAAAATELISQTFNIDIPYYIRLDFKAFAEIINELDGVTVTVDRSFTDPMFPAPYDEYQTVSFTAGEQTMDGQTALTFARSRHGNNNEGSDFARARRQQKILLALKQKLSDIGTYLNPLRANNIMNSLESHLTTNMEFDELVSLAKTGQTLDTGRIISLVLDSNPDGFLKSTFTSSGAYILYPKTDNFNAINDSIKLIFNGDPNKAIALTNASAENPFFNADIKNKEKNPVETFAPKTVEPILEIQNGTWNAGLAARVRRRLEFRSIAITTVNNTQEKPISQSKIYVLQKNTPSTILDILVDELKISTTQNIPSTIHPSTSTDILIMLGDDFID
ncbi:MAG: hypothetical protein A2821_02390 [Candidatus Magasanikbacteria bacterium RIFCSPHIGHO2_01_FULL_41_23]|uniref:Cell envelope-related transcriptional attenuator domain-containing protein n=1 Tax=Candidatus Magasanikbacteria bacterium RIFCSPLOWO2_01_FULL_40_15 TaxID=1798686 RepID=A0A1F6N340_9BACT|nr:MAG: hypothetical protein A2821_02390 [Candidatus Magasanikbacteria bacterium RIFCSPHIGHO2_01_FULL_41_23]OGH66862.1 MAG: hypothetical protein A3C66_02175 [Candidatus Magasanikbacteria bacterium RIFCSPHIGHO2_02_FULL_41_35]OGH74845.1 MAG: hypothetical protein A3F22_04100 [Candidatus Magasanikbacteria bacterium RIFCSPHIGHO2_12_FULL_41_16]OGH78120.1 MAG: hypothetical protein A2983_03525 [Candidatus Magasanikbacteria bacterium RIFCSPLOWO2_01_FULL_40_15]